MNVIQHSTLPRFTGAGCCSQTVAGAQLGRLPFEVAMQTIEAGASTETEFCSAARVLLVLAGSGRLVLDSGSQRFQAPCTLLVPPGARHRLVNNGAPQLQLVSIHASAMPTEVAEP